MGKNGEGHVCDTEQGTDCGPVAVLLVSLLKPLFILSLAHIGPASRKVPNLCNGS